MILDLVKEDIPILIWGHPGIGKTAHIMSLAKEAGAHVEVQIGSTMDPTDLGRPYIKDEGMVIEPPPWAVRLRDAMSKGKEAWLFLDELTCAPPTIQAALLRVVNERFVGSCDLRGCKMIAASNPQETAANGVELTAATSNRWCHLEFGLDASNWCNGELSGWGHPDPKYAEARGYITSYISKVPNALLQVPKVHEDNIRGWASPRTWSMSVKALSSLKEGVNNKDARMALSGLIGAEAATEFITWCLDTKLPHPKDVLEGKKEIPARGDQQLFCVNMCISYALAHQVTDKFWPILDQLRKDLKFAPTQRAYMAFTKAGIKVTMTPQIREVLDAYKDPEYNN
jgi:hypothetical protein